MPRGGPLRSRGPPAPGLTGPEAAFEDERGFLKLLNRGEAVEAELDTIGRRRRLCDPGLLFKTSPVCSAALAAIEQMNELMAELGASADEIAGIHAEAPELVYGSLVFSESGHPAGDAVQPALRPGLRCAPRAGAVRGPGARRRGRPANVRAHGAGECKARA